MAMDRVQRRIGSLLDEADAALVEGDWASVLDRTQKVLALEPDNAEALTFKAAAERSLGDDPTESVAHGGSVRGSPAPPSAPAVTPTSFANGRYQVKGLLGEGGRKRVYQAHDSVLDRDVALAVIKTEGLDPTSRVRITREAQAMGRLGDHPHVLQIFDLGDEAGALSSSPSHAWWGRWDPTRGSRGPQTPSGTGHRPGYAGLPWLGVRPLQGYRPPGPETWQRVAHR